MRANDYAPPRVERYLVHIEVWDNETKRALVLEQYNTNSLVAAENDLRDAADHIEEIDRGDAL